MSLEIKKSEQQQGSYQYEVVCQEAGYHFTLTGKGETATEADAELQRTIIEMKQRLDEVMQMSKASA